MFAYTDVIDRALQIISRGAPFSWSDHGECCPWCAIATAKGELDDEHNTGVSFAKATSDLIWGFEEVESDGPLVFARKALGQWNDVDLSSITKEEAERILLEAKSVTVIDL